MKKILFYILFLSTLSFHLVGQTWAWAKSMSSALSAGGNHGWSAKTDFNSNVFISGRYSSQVLVAGTTTLSNPNYNWTAFIAKYDKNGNPLWLNEASNGGGSVASSVGTDNNGNAFITGNYGYPLISFGTNTLTLSAGEAIFLTKYDPSGNAVWAKSFGGVTNSDFANSVSTDQSGNIFLTGYFMSQNPTFGATTFTNDGGKDLFLAKLDPTGNVLWARSPKIISGSNEALDVCTDQSGNSIMTGYFGNPTITFGTYTLTGSSVGSIYIVKYDPNGNVLWAKGFNGNGWNGDVGNALATDINGNIYLTGCITSTSLVMGTYTLTSSGIGKMFIAKFDPSGNILWIKQSGGTGRSSAGGVSTYSTGLYITGDFSGTITLGTNTLTAPSGTNAPHYLAQMDPNGNFICTTALSDGTMGNDGKNGLSVNNAGEAFISGNFSINPFIIGSTTLTPTPSCKQEIFVAKFYCQEASVNELNGSSENILLYPNPVKNILTIKSDWLDKEKTEIEIKDLLGKSILQKQVSDINNSSIDACDLNSGIYFISISADGKRSVRKFVKE